MSVETAYRNENWREIDLSVVSSPYRLPSIDMRYYSHVTMETEVLATITGGTVLTTECTGVFEPEATLENASKLRIGGPSDGAPGTSFDIAAASGTALGERRQSMPCRTVGSAAAAPLCVPYAVFVLNFDHTAGKIRFKYQCW